MFSKAEVVAPRPAVGPAQAVPRPHRLHPQAVDSSEKNGKDSFVQAGGRYQ